MKLISKRSSKSNPNADQANSTPQVTMLSDEVRIPILPDGTVQSLAQPSTPVTLQGGVPIAPQVTVQPAGSVISQGRQQVPSQSDEVRIPAPPTIPQSEVQTPAQSNEVQMPAQPNEEQVPEQVSPAPENIKPKAPEVHMYPEATLSEKQLAALHSVIRPSSQSGQNPEKADATDDPHSSSNSAARKPVKIKSGNASIVKTVFFVLFLIAFLGAAGFAGWYYWWTNYATFEYDLRTVVILDGQNVDADDFLHPIDVEEGISAALQDSGFEPSVGLQFVPLNLALGWRSMEATAALYVLTPIDSIEHEFAVEGALLRPVDFLANYETAAGVTFDIQFTENPLPLEDYPVGEFTLYLTLNGVPFSAMLYVVDTTPPIATTVPVVILIGESVSPEDFITDIIDASPIAHIIFVEEPDVLSSYDEQIVKIEIEDVHGNSSVFESILTIIFNQMLPLVEGVPEMIESKVGTPVEYPMEGVFALDDFDRVIDVHVDSSEVDEDTEGTYTAVYWAEDLTGLRTEVEVTVHIISANPEDIYQEINDILGRITNDRMTQAEKATAIHNWVRNHLARSTTGSDSESLLATAHKALRDRRGDSTIYSTLSEVMLTVAGIPNMPIERVSETAPRHRWLLINPDEKGWHHFDPFPTGLVLGNLTSLFTEAEAKDLARRINAHNKTEDYYTYNPALYPAIVQE